MQFKKGRITESRSDSMQRIFGFCLSEQIPGYCPQDGEDNKDIEGGGADEGAMKRGEARLICLNKAEE